MLFILSCCLLYQRQATTADGGFFSFSFLRFLVRRLKRTTAVRTGTGSVVFGYAVRYSFVLVND